MPNQPASSTALGHIRQIDYTVVFVHDLEAMRRFYEEVMEFPLTRKLSDRWFEYQIGSTILALTSSSGRFDDTSQTPAGQSLQLAFRVSPQIVAACAAELDAKGIALVSPLTDHAFGHRTIFFRDPDGNLLEIYAEI